MTPWKCADLIDRYLSEPDRREVLRMLDSDYRNWRLAFRPVPRHRQQIESVIVAMVRGWPSVVVVPRVVAPALTPPTRR